MTLSAEQFFDDRVETTVETRMGDLALRYRPYAVTPQMQAAIEDAAESEHERVVEAFCAVVDWIDMEGPLLDPEDRDKEGNPRVVLKKGEMVPVEFDYINLLPSRLLFQILAGIMEHMGSDESPKPAKASRPGKKRSRGRSFARD